MENISFNDLPQAVNQLYNKLEAIERLLLQGGNNAHPKQDHWLDLTELCNYLPDKPIKSTVYGWVQAGLIPHHKGAKKLRFLKSEIDQWLKTGKKNTIAEIASEACSYMVAPKKRRVCI